MRTRIYVDLAGDGAVSDAGVDWYGEASGITLEQAFITSAEVIAGNTTIGLFVLLLDLARSHQRLAFPDGGDVEGLGQTIFGDDLETF